MAAKVAAREHDDGAISLGVVRDGKFLALVTVPAGRVAVVEREAQGTETADDDGGSGGA